MADLMSMLGGRFGRVLGSDMGQSGWDVGVELAAVGPVEGEVAGDPWMRQPPSWTRVW